MRMQVFQRKKGAKRITHNSQSERAFPTKFVCCSSHLHSGSQNQLDLTVYLTVSLSLVESARLPQPLFQPLSPVWAAAVIFPGRHFPWSLFCPGSVMPRPSLAPDVSQEPPCLPSYLVSRPVRFCRGVFSPPTPHFSTASLGGLYC